MERRVKCIYHLTHNSENDTRNTHLQTLIPEYYNIDLAINALDIDESDKSHNYIGRLLIDKRSQGKRLGKKLESNIIKTMKQQWMDMRAKTNPVVNHIGAIVPRQTTQIVSKQTCQPLAVVTRSVAKKISKKRKGGAVKRKCCFVGCTNHSGISSIKFQRIPPPIFKKNLDKAPLRAHYSYHRKVAYRSELLDRCGLSRKDTTKKLRMCSAHECEDVSITKYFMKELKQYSIKLDMHIPKGKGMCTSPTTASKGQGWDRRARQYLEESVSNNSNGGWQIIAQAAQ